MYNVYVDVPREFSRKGEVTISTSFLKDNPYVEGTKDIRFKEDYEINTRVYSFYNKDSKDKNKYEDIKITAGNLAVKVNERFEADKAKAAAKEADAPEAEADDRVLYHSILFFCVFFI